MILLLIYFGINLFVAGMSVSDFNTRKENFQCVSILLLFGVILIFWEFFFAEKFEKWFDSSKFGFWWKLNIERKYDSLHHREIEYIKSQIAQEKDKNSILVKQLKRILKRNHN